MDIPGRGGSSKQARRDQVPFQKNRRLPCFWLQVTPKTPLNAPPTPEEDPSQLYGTPLRSQLLDAARERLKAHIPRLRTTETDCGTYLWATDCRSSYSNAFAAFLPLTTGAQRRLPAFAKGPTAPAERQPPLPSAAGTVPFGRRAPGHAERLARSSFLRPDLKAYRTAPQIQWQSSAAPE